MAVRIDQVLEYLDHHPVCYYADDVESMLGMLYDIYEKHNTVSSDKLDSCRQKLDIVLDSISDGDKTQCNKLINDICKEHEQLAFIHGVIVGLSLMSEIRTVISDSAV